MGLIITLVELLVMRSCHCHMLLNAKCILRLPRILSYIFIKTLINVMYSLAKVNLLCQPIYTSL